MPGSAPLAVTSESFEHLEAEWAALHAATPTATPFTHPAWHSAWLKHFGAASNPVFLAFRDGPELVAVAALDHDATATRSLGDHNVRDYGGPLVRFGDEGRTAPALFEWLRNERAQVAELWGVDGDSAMRAALRQAADASGWSSEEQPEAVCPLLELPAGFEPYVASLSKKDRHELRRKLRNLDGAGDVQFHAATGEDVAGEMELLFAMMRASRSDKDEFLTPAMEAFFRDLAATFGPLGLARLARLELDGRPVAALFLFENASTTFLYNSGYDPAFSGLAVGLLSKAHAIRDAIERGMQRFDFLRGEEEYKRRLGGSPHEVVTLRFRPGAQ